MSEDEMLKAAMKVVAAEETVLGIGRELAKTRTVEIKPLPTYIIDRTGIIITGDEIIINEAGMGVLQEFMVKSTNPNFTIFVFRDEKLEIDGSYSHYAAISQEIDEIAAFERTGVYIFHVSDIEFAKSLVVKIFTTQAVTFNNIFAKYKLGI